MSVLARVNYREDRRVFGLTAADRRTHVYVIGKTGTGKSTLLETLIRQDLGTRQGLALLDPHGDLVERVRAAVPTERLPDLVYLDLPDGASGFSFNPLAGVAPESRPLAASSLLDVFKKLWIDSWGPRLEHILRNALLVLLDQPEATLADILRLLSDDDFRRHAARNTANQQVRSFWLREFADYPARFRIEAIAPVQNKVGAFLANPLLYRLFTGTSGQIDLRAIMDEGKILLVNLAKGEIGEDTASLFGALLVASFGSAALGRASTPESERPDFWVYVDEFHHFTTLSLATMLSELRKYRVGLVLAHQYVAQLDPTLQAAVFGNVGTILCFRVGSADAEILARELGPEVRESDLPRLPNHHAYVRLMVDGQPTDPFSIETIPPA